MSDDPFQTYDAAYVLGALSPDDRHAFEQHLRSCDQCAESVRELAGIPGLLARAEIADADESPELPDLLPSLLRTAHRERLRRRWVSSGGWIAAAAAAAAIVLIVVLQPAAPRALAPAEPMRALNNTPISAEISVNGVTWGTKLELRCKYPAGYEPDERYTLVVHDRSGADHDIGAWKTVPGVTATMAASTDVAAADIDTLAVLDSERTPILIWSR